jgi:hypothetical protein
MTRFGVGRYRDSHARQTDRRSTTTARGGDHARKAPRRSKSARVCAEFPQVFPGEDAGGVTALPLGLEGVMAHDHSVDHVDLVGRGQNCGFV